MALQILDPIRPYLAVIRVGIGAVLLAANFIGGCNHGEKPEGRRSCGQGGQG